MFSLPDHMTEKVTDYTPAFFLSRGIKTLFLDIDNTLVPYDVPLPTDEIRAWLTALETAGIGCFFLSNNSPERVERFAAGLPCRYLADASKPLTRKIRAFAAEQGVTMQDAAAVGDQIFTDVWAAHALGIRCFLVRSIKPVDTFFFRFKRTMEKPFFALYRLRERKNRT